jgi:proline-specific peptidase
MSETNDDTAWDGWKCDDLTPDLCELQVEIGHLSVKGGINLTYWTYSKASSSDDTTTKLPIIAIHGGPGVAHNYMLPLKQQACRGRSVIFYDQAGCGKSKLPENASLDDFPWLLDPRYYSLEELPALVDHLGFDDYHLVGSSWGSLLCQMFALDAADEHLASMALSGTFSDAQHYVQGQWDPEDGNLGTLPPYVQERLHKLEKQEAYESDEYQAIADVLSAFFTSRTDPVPDCVSDAYAGTNQEIYVGMQGPSEFNIAGSLEFFNTTKRLSELTDLPVLLTSGKFDTMRPKVVKEAYRALPMAEWVLLERSGHMTMIDEPGRMNDVVADFFDRVESSRASGISFSPVLEEYRLTNMKQQEGLHTGEVIGTVVLSAVIGWFLGYYSAARNQRANYSQLNN